MNQLCRVAALSALIGYILFFGGVSDAYVAIFTLMFTVLLEVFLTQTGGPRYTFGKASLGGYNGMIDIPPITLGVGGTRLVFVGEAFYYLTLTLLVVVYLLLRMLVNSAWGYTMIAVREDPNRTEMLGYDIRKVQLTAFTLAGGLAGLSGVLYAAWNNIMTPTTVNATAATMPIIWVATAGRKSSATSHWC